MKKVIRRAELYAKRGRRWTELQYVQPFILLNPENKGGRTEMKPLSGLVSYGSVTFARSCAP